MLNRLPAFAAGAAIAALVGGGITYATAADDTGADRASGPVMISRSLSYRGIVLQSSDDGAYDIIGGFAKCPRGTQVTGGGYYDGTTDGLTFESDPDATGKERWFVAVFASSGQATDAVVVTVTCYGPKGKFPATAYRGAAARPSQAKVAHLTERANTLR